MIKPPDIQISDWDDPKHEELKKVETSGKTLLEVAVPKEKWIHRFWHKIVDTAKGKTVVGKALGVGLDFILPSKFNKLRVATKHTLGLNPERQPMVQKILSLKNFINVKDENGNFSTEELLASVVQILLAGAVVWGATKLGIFDQLMSLLGS